MIQEGKDEMKTGNCEKLLFVVEFTCRRFSSPTILVVSHLDRDTSFLGLIAHGFQFSDSGCPGFFQINGGASGLDTFLEQSRIVGRASRHQGQAFLAFRDGGQVFDGCQELHTVRGFHVLGPSRKFRTSGARGAYS